MNNKIKQREKQWSNTQCVNCVRCHGITENDEFDCKYGKTHITSEKPKCKYFKRNPKYNTVSGAPKIYSTYKHGVETKVRYIRGKFVKQ